MQTDLLGEPMTDADCVAKVRPRRTRPWMTAYAGGPGTGPNNERCWTCLHYARVQGGSRYYPKCGLMRHAWTHGPGSDIKARSAACHRWTAKFGAEVQW